MVGHVEDGAMRAERDLRKPMLKLFLLFSSVLLAVGCDSSPEKFSSGPAVKFSTNIHNTNWTSVAEFSFWRGGGYNKSSNEMQANENYRPIEVMIVSGPDLPEVQYQQDGIEKYVLKSNTPLARSMVEILEDEQPWRWKNRNAWPIANTLVFTGKAGNKNWKSISTYPDPELESFLGKIRKRLKKAIRP